MAYYSTDNEKVYHDCRNCTDGIAIPAEKMKDGQPAGAEQCKSCYYLQRDLRCTPGTPV